MRPFRVLAATAIMVAVVLGTGSAAHAALGGPCTASGTVTQTGRTYDAKTVNHVTLPRKGDVAWQGAVPGSGRRTVSGSVHVKLPWPIGDRAIGSWGKESDTHANSGNYHYDFPSVLAGIDVPVSGFHREAGVYCPGAVVVTLEGNKGIKNPATWGTLALTALSTTTLIVSFRPRRIS